MATSIDGLVSGIDTQKIIDGLLSIQQKQIDQLNSKRTAVLNQKSAVQQIESRLISFRSVAGSLGKSQSSVFSTRTVSVSDDAFLSATATSKTAVGQYQIRVNSLASAHQIGAQGYADANSAVTEGTLQIRVGNGTVSTITVDSTNNTLQGVADAINAASGDVTASIIRDGSGGGTPYRLILTSKKTGTDNQISITNNLAASSGNAVQLAFDTANPIEAARDASISLGSGPGAVTVSSSTNTIDNLLGGVTLNLTKADPNEQLTLSVTQDTKPATDAVQQFVDAFNDLMKFIDNQVKYDQDSKQAGILIGNQSVIQLQDQVRRAVLDVVPGTGSLNRLTAIGVSVNDQGQLDFDPQKLQNILNGKVAGVSGADVAKLFSLSGDSSSQQVQFVLGSTRTKASTTPYGVDVAQAPEQATITAANPLADSIVIDGTNNTLSLSIDGLQLDGLILDPGTYTRTTLAQQLQSVIMSSSNLKGRSVAVGLNGDSLRITSQTYGASSKLSITGGTALAALGLTGTESDVGVDVAGSFLVNGETETATGRGRVLTGDLDNANTADLQVRVSLTTGQLGAGPEATLTVTRGVASRIDQVLGKLLDSASGRVKHVEDSFDTQAGDIQKAIDRQQDLFNAQQQSLLKQFQAMETALSQLQSTSNALGSQLQSVNNLKAGA
ncbi:MAG: flagellar filament capping protein FliD [Planctomycetaceae bacterium]